MDGLLVVDKPVGPTSHDVVARVRRLLRERRVGHTGTLDPMASGVLPLVIGRATRLARFLSAGDKQLRGRRAPRHATDTYDAMGSAMGTAYPARCQTPSGSTGRSSLSRHVPAAAAGVLGEEDRRRAQLPAGRDRPAIRSDGAGVLRTRRPRPLPCRSGAGRCVGRHDQWAVDRRPRRRSTSPARPASTSARWLTTSGRRSARARTSRRCGGRRRRARRSPSAVPLADARKRGRAGPGGADPAGPPMLPTCPAVTPDRTTRVRRAQARPGR